MQRAVIYAKALTTFGIQRQIKKAQRYANKYNLEIISIHADFDLRTVDINTQPKLIQLQFSAAKQGFQYLLVKQKTIISKDAENLINIESYLDRLGIKIISVGKRNL